jgi:16S rRNA (guanine966-N2)-methyltransferase
MRVIGGHDRGRRLRAPRGLATRPTADRVRVTLFDVLGPAVAGARVLDLFAGTGAVGIEALSRGAARVVLVERDQSALRALRANLAALGAPRAAARTLEGFGGTRVCRAGTEVIVQHSTRTTLPTVPGLAPHRRPRQFGDTALTFLRAEEYTPDGSRP